MRIAVLNPHMRAKYSGPTEFMNRLFGAVFRTYGCAVVAIGPELPDNLVPELSYQKISGPPATRMLGQMVWVLKANWWLWQNRTRYDYVHLHGAYAFNLLSAVVPMLLGRPFGILPLGAGGDLSDDARSNRIALLRVLKMYIVRQAALGFALSHENELELVQAGVRADRVKRLNNPAPPQFFRPPSWGPEPSHTLVFVGELGPRKRPELILEAIRRLSDQGWSDVKGVFIGPFVTPEYEQGFAAQISRLKLKDAVDIRGYTSDVAAELPSTECVFVLPSRQEGLPGALSEAMAWGMPVVVTAAGAMGDIVNQSGAGFVIQPESDELADAVAQIWADPALGARLATRAQAYAREYYSEESVSASFMSSLEQLELK